MYALTHPRAIFCLHIYKCILLCDWERIFKIETLNILYGIAFLMMLRCMLSQPQRSHWPRTIVCHSSKKSDRRFEYLNDDLRWCDSVHSIESNYFWLKLLHWDTERCARCSIVSIPKLSYTRNHVIKISHTPPCLPHIRCDYY